MELMFRPLGCQACKSGGDYGTWSSALAVGRTHSRYHYYSSGLPSLKTKAPKGAFANFAVGLMSTSDLTLEHIALGRNQIAEQMEAIANQRKLIAALEIQGQSARPERDLLRELLRTFESTLAELRQKSDDAASDGHG
jgi:hypothetical protein